MVKGQYYDRRKIENFRKGLYLCYVQMAMKQLLKKRSKLFFIKTDSVMYGFKTINGIAP